MNETRLKGNFIGGTINYGYALQPVYTEQNGKQVQTATKVVVNEDEAAVVREIFTEYINGKKITEMVTDFFRNGILNRGKPFIVDTIYKILRCEKYTGIYRIYGNVYDKIYPPIISTEIFQAAKAKIDANKYGKHTKTARAYILKGKLFCGFCGRRMYSYAGTSKSGTVFRYYKCSQPEVCGNKQTVKKDVLETAITKAFEQMLSTESNLNLLADKILETYNNKLYDTSSLRFAEKELNRVEHSLTNLIAAVENGFFSDTTNTRLKELEQRKTEFVYLFNTIYCGYIAFLNQITTT